MPPSEVPILKFEPARGRHGIANCYLFFVRFSLPFPVVLASLCHLSFARAPNVGDSKLQGAVIVRRFPAASRATGQLRFLGNHFRRLPVASGHRPVAGRPVGKRGVLNPMGAAWVETGWATQFPSVSPTRQHPKSRPPQKRSRQCATAQANVEAEILQVERGHLSPRGRG